MCIRDRKNIGQIFDAKDIGNKNGISKKINIVSEGIILPVKYNMWQKRLIIKRQGMNTAENCWFSKTSLIWNICGTW